MTQQVKFVLVGDAVVGKTSLLVKYMYNDTYDQYVGTV